MNTKILASLLVIGIVGSTAAAGTMAYFSDEEISEDNTFAAGELDLGINWDASYNGEEVSSQDEIVDCDESHDNPTCTVFELDDIKPGDSGQADFGLQPFDNPAYIWINVNVTENLDNSCPEPEENAEPGCHDDNVGELPEGITLTVTDNDGNEVVSDEPVENVAGQGYNLGVYDGGDIGDLTVEWNFPTDAGNQYQTDSMTLDFTFHAQQERHNDGTVNPFDSS